MPVQSTSRPPDVDSGGTGARVVPFPRVGEPFKGLRELRVERGWSQADAVRAMVACATDKEKKSLPGPDTLLHNWKRWEAGKVEPDGGRTGPFYRPIIARIFGTIPEKMFPPRREPRILRVTGTGDLMNELSSRRDQIHHTIRRLEDELAYLDAVLAVPVPVPSR